ncbi:hypothetical protein B0T16DRAFT_157644 [Cercophora newfieldiana]|uniref:Uncharacterized protein n=1 Tax=Cercophora newfieldiana TaxID=92897 RepID=A0AA39Y580_9PEZI|nr:hypothetical protein B0T16DRAFT_157644 [Cercophora newfieldiana]
MDDTARLVSELHDKLAELDGKVAAYQRDMLAQFHKHMDDCLKGYPEHVSNEVSRVIAASMSKYSALSPRDSGDQSPRSDDLEDAARIAWDGRKSPPPILYHTSGKPKEGPRSPHEREKEFQGLFTPSYLPLLDSSYNSPLHSPPISPQATLTTFAPPIETPEKVEEPTLPDGVPEGAVRPGAIRRSTDRSLSSVESSGSETKARRSALRRSSSSAKGSPRRVRFDFEGEEVLPSSSPEERVAIFTLADEAEETEPQAQPEAAVPDTSAIVDADDSSYSLGMSLLDVEGEEDLLPRPRKVSSTQALQALTRSPLDAGTTWTVVNADPEEVPKMNGDKEAACVSKPEVREQPQSLTPAKLKPDIAIHVRDGPIENHRLDELLGSPIEELEEYHDEDDDSEEEFLSMSTKLSRKTPSPVAQMPFPKTPEASVPALLAPAAGSKGHIQPQVRTLPVPAPNNKANLEDEEGDLFDIDDVDEGGKTEKYLPDDDSNEDEAPISERLRLRLAHAAHAAHAGSQPTPPLEGHDRSTGNTVPPVSPSAALFSASVGSFNGRPLPLGPMNNAQLYDEIASMKNVHFLVGSIDGRTGIDSADPGSYRASLAKQVMGTPRSFTERLAIEEAMERRQEEEEGNQ